CTSSMEMCPAQTIGSYASFTAVSPALVVATVAENAFPDKDVGRDPREGTSGTQKVIVDRRTPLGLQQRRTSIKGSPNPSSPIHFSFLILLGNQICRQSQDMSCYTQCVPCQPCGPTPLASSCNEPCVRQCQNSNVVIEPSSVVVTLPGPILSSFPQNTVVGSSTSAAVGSILSSEGVPITSGGFDLSGFGSRYCGRRCNPY
ncbi:hypothetical protein ASZ78_004590, partial [Callipepla squamata]